MKKFLLSFVPFFAIFVLLFLNVAIGHADQLDDITKQINDLTTQLNMSVNATRPLESQLTSMKQQITTIKVQVAAIDTDVAAKKQQIDTGYKDIAQKEKVLNATIRDFYIKSSYNSPLLIFLSGSSASEITQILAYQKASADQDKAIITNIALSITDLEAKRQALQDEETRLIAVKASLDDESAKLEKLVQGAKAYQASLSSQIAQLSAKQQSLLAAKLGSLNIPLFAIAGGGCSSDINPYKDPGFGGPKFGLFSYGVPNRVGLNQYGAWGRAKAGQSYDQILSAYYNYDSISDVSQSTQIHVLGNGIDMTVSLEEYMKRIYEVPDSWTDNDSAALKAQAIAARSYVLSYTNNGQNSICPTDSCQVFQTNPKGGNWEQAVNATAGKAMMQGGQPIKAWFSSTHGGYMFSSADIGWSATSFTKHSSDASGPINSFADLNNNAYDKGSPWFYCDWGGRSQYNNTAWLTSSEMADIVNSILLVQNEPSADPHILQPDQSDPEMWTPDQVKQELSKYQTPFSSITAGSVAADFGSGKSTSVTFSGDTGTVTFDSSTFRKYFNLRAPAKIQIVGYLYNIEVR